MVYVIISIFCILLFCALHFAVSAFQPSNKSEPYFPPAYSIDRAVVKYGFDHIKIGYRDSEERRFVIAEARQYGSYRDDTGLSAIILTPMGGYNLPDVVNELRRQLKKFEETRF